MANTPTGKQKNRKAQKWADRSARSGRAQAVADIVPSIGRAAFYRFGFVQSAVVSRWHEIVGPRYAEASAPESIRFPAGRRDEGTLTLTVESAFAPMLQQVVPEVMERVNRFFGYRAVVRVILRHGQIASVKPSKPVNRADVKVPDELVSDLPAIADEELRARLESLAHELCLTEELPVFDAKSAPIGYRPARKADGLVQNAKGRGPIS